mmetsp:Transcript_23380/g.27503  ORF Transcript_23380/g.27503 Transcript_23380/m.27503 type:complete len:84 (+) Transcript_23380:161-412(+)
MDGWTMDGWLHGWEDEGGMDGWRGGCIDVWVSGGWIRGKDGVDDGWMDEAKKPGRQQERQCVCVFLEKFRKRLRLSYTLPIQK